MRRLIPILAVLIVILAAYFGVQYMVNTKKVSEHVDQTISDVIATSSLDTTPQKALVANVPTATTTTPTNWKVYTSPVLASTTFNVAYPANMRVSYDQNVLRLTFPTDKYFHWPLQDEAYVTISASSTCPDLIVEHDPNIATTTFSINGYAFSAIEGNGVGAGNLYQEIAYDTYENNICYHLSLFDHGSNGAGLYVDDQALIKRYDDQHTKDTAAILSVFNSITNSFVINAVQ